MDVKDLFNKGYAEFYASYNSSQLARFSEFSMPWIVPLLPERREVRILDIGCGPGLLLGYLRRLGYSWATGIDISADQIQAAQVKLGECVYQADLFEHLSLFSGWHVLICNDVIEHIPKDKLLNLPALFKHSLAPGGRVIIRTANADCPLASRGRYIDLTHEAAFTEYSLRQLMALGGFRGQVVSQHPGKALWKRAVFAIRDWLWRMVYRLYESKPPTCGDAALVMVFKLHPL